MRKILDLHIHSRFSRACSRSLTLENLDKTCRVKGVDIIATGDFTHPVWFSEIMKQLEATQETRNKKQEISKLADSAGSPLYRLKSSQDNRVKFILSTELALIYKQGERTRRIHIVIHAPNIEAAEGLNTYLEKSGYNLKSDGRPILGMSAEKLVKICLDIHPKFLVYPAHIWTPWFSVFGSKSGFDTFEECFGEQTGHIYAYETGLSSDPEMNWRVSSLDKLTLISNSDAHSPANIAREANIMDLEYGSYDEIYEAIKDKDLNKIKGAIEFYPEEGMYHLDGHRSCGVRMEPSGSRKNRGICPKCKKPLTIGVLNRVEELADRPQGIRPEGMADFIKLVELDKIIAQALGMKSRNSKQVQREYEALISQAGNELDILMNIEIEKLVQITKPRIAQGIKRVREGNLLINPGFDGQYGKVSIFGDSEKKNSSQAGLFE